MRDAKEAIAKFEKGELKSYKENNQLLFEK